MKLLAIDASGKSETVVIDKSRKIGEGATASVYRVTLNNELWAAKIYNTDRAAPLEKLEAMLKSPPSEITKIEGGQAFIQYTWVNYLLKDTRQRLVGFIMPFVDQAATNSLDTYYDPVLIKRLTGVAQSALSLRIEIAKNLCQLIANLHALGHHFIDIKPQNVRVYKDNNKVVLMDCDGYSIKNKIAPPDRFPADLISTDFIAPEVLKNHLSPKSLGEEQDRYGLAVILFQLLNRGTHPFQGIITNPNINVSTNDERAAIGLYPHGITLHPSVKPRPQSVHELLLPETRRLFDQAFTKLDRPSAKTWFEHFEKILNNKLLVRCKSHPKDVRHIHFKDLECIGCRIKSLQRKNTKAPSTYRKYEVKPPEVPLQSVKNSTTGSLSARYTSTSSISTTSSKNNSSNWWLIGFSVIALLVFIGHFGKSVDTSTQSSSSSTTTTYPSSNTTTYPKLNDGCGQIGIYNLTNTQICLHYHSNLYPNCTSNLLNELTTRQAKVFPVEECGQPKAASGQTDSSPPQKPKPDVEQKEPTTISEKMSYVSQKSTSPKITWSSISHDTKAAKYFYEIDADIIKNLNDSTRSVIDGLVVHSNVRLSYLSSFTLTGHGGESCETQSLGRIASCIVERNVAKCQFNEIPNARYYCVETFSK